MIVQFMVKDYDGFCHHFEENLDSAKSVAERIFKQFSTDLEIKNISVSKYLTDDTCGPIRFWGWFDRGDSFDKINSYLNAL